jgi:hypothetical protein
MVLHLSCMLEGSKFQFETPSHAAALRNGDTNTHIMQDSWTALHPAGSEIVMAVYATAYFRLLWTCAAYINVPLRLGAWRNLLSG